MGQQAWLGEREAISYAAIIYSSLGMEEEKEAFTAGVINIFGSQPRWALLGSCHPLNAPSSHWNQRFAEKSSNHHQQEKKTYFQWIASIRLNRDYLGARILS